jgi:predicted secreted Zn-dependent protease
VGIERAATATREGPSRRAAEPSFARCAPGFDVALNPATIGALIADADGGTRERLMGALQQRHGNAAVQRLLAPASALPVQRWAVTLPPGTTDCARVVSYMNANSPYRADSGWARTNARFNWGGDPAYTTSDGVTTATVTSPTVTRTGNVDMPRWAPTDPAMASAWSAMTSDLRAHEAIHEGIADTWESTLRDNLASLSVTVANRSIATFRAAVQAEWNSWMVQHQDEQNGIDPYTALLDCSGGESGGASESAPITGLDDEPDLSGA